MNKDDTRCTYRIHVARTQTLEKTCFCNKYLIAYSDKCDSNVSAPVTYVNVKLARTWPPTRDRL